MRKDERLIQFCDLTLFGKSRAQGLAQINHPAPKQLDFLIEQMSLMANEGVARVKINSGTRELVLQEVGDRDDYHILLINSIDGRVQNPVARSFSGVGKDERKSFIIGENNGLELSVHVLIAKKPDNHRHLCLVEKVDSVPAREISKFLNNMMKLVKDRIPEEFKLPHPNGARNATYNVTPSCEFQYHPSPKFTEELNGGVIEDITLLTSPENLRGFDAKKHQLLREVQVKASIDRGVIGNLGSNIKYLTKFVGIGSDTDAAFVRVRFRDESGAGHSAKLSTDTGNLIETDRYILKRKITDFGDYDDTSCEKIHAKIVDAMIQLAEG